MINIIGGIKKRTKIQVPIDNVRPTSIKKRESIFSIIESYGLKNNINIYSIHTNLDNVNDGVNKKICDILGLKKTKILVVLVNLVGLEQHLPFF